MQSGWGGVSHPVLRQFLLGRITDLFDLDLDAQQPLVLTSPDRHATHRS